MIWQCQDLSHLKQGGCVSVEASAENEMFNGGTCLSMLSAGGGSESLEVLLFV